MVPTCRGPALEHPARLPRQCPEPRVAESTVESPWDSCVGVACTDHVRGATRACWSGPGAACGAAGCCGSVAGHRDSTVLPAGKGDGQSELAVLLAAGDSLGMGLRGSGNPQARGGRRCPHRPWTGGRPLLLGSKFSYEFQGALCTCGGWGGRGPARPWAGGVSLLQQQPHVRARGSGARAPQDMAGDA